MATTDDDLSQYLPGMGGTLTRPPTADDIAKRTAASQPFTMPTAHQVGAGIRNYVTNRYNEDIANAQAIRQPFVNFYNGLTGKPESATQNAVIGANNAAGTPPGGSFDMSADIGVSSRSAVPAAQPNGLPTGVTDLGGGVVRRGNTYSNMGVAGLDDIDSKRGTMPPSAVSFLNRVPDGDLNPPAATQATAALPTFDAQPHAGQIASLESEAAPLLRSRGIASNYQGRVLMRQARNLAAQDVAQSNAQTGAVNANSTALLARNQLPIAQMRNATDLRQQDLALLPHLPKMALDNAALGAVKKGDYNTAREISTLGQLKYPPNPLPFSAHGDAALGMVVLNPYDGSTRFMSPQELQAQAADRRKQDAARSVLGQ